MSSGIPSWLKAKLNNYKTYDIDNLSFHNSLCIQTNNVNIQKGGGLFTHPKNIREYRNVIKNTLLKNYDNVDNDYFD
tara:strand:+ start:160 stop:390 length:231 start_codon:yes stop_codon:yes gene_type:complete